MTPWVTPSSDRLAEGNWEGNHGGRLHQGVMQHRLAEGNWEGNHGLSRWTDNWGIRLAEGNWEGNHGQPDA